MYFFLWLLYLRFCVYAGSKRIMGPYTALMYGLCFGPLGAFMIFSSRRLDDEWANAALIEKYKVA